MPRTRSDLSLLRHARDAGWHRVVLGIGVSADNATRLTSVLAESGSAYVAPSRMTDIDAALGGGTRSVIVFEVPTLDDDAAAVLFRHVKARFPHCPVIALHRPGTSGVKALARAAALGITEILVVDGVLPTAEFLMCLSACRTESVARTVWSRARADIDAGLETILVRALRMAERPITLSALAVNSGMPERSLRQYCERHGYPNPQWIIGWARLLCAAYYIEEPGRSIDSIANLLEYSSPSAFRNQLRRYTGLTASSVRAGGAIHTVARALERDVRTVDAEAAPALRLVR